MAGVKVPVVFKVAGAAAVNTAMGGMGSAATKLAVAFAGVFAVKQMVDFGKAAVSTSADFQQSMANVKAISGATGVSFREMTALAQEMGETTQFTARQSADALQFLSMAGLDAQESMTALPGILNLAAAGSMDLATAADLATNVLGGMRLGVDELGRVNDVLAVTASNANTNVVELAGAMRIAGPIAAAMGVEIEEVSAILGGMANLGIKAETAGQGLKQMFARLTKAMNDTGDTKANVALTQLGINLEDADGKMRPMVDILRDLNSAGMGASEAMDIFGRFTFSTALAATGAANDIAKLTEKTRDAEGAAQKMADIKLDTFAGDMKILASAWEGLNIAIGATVTESDNVRGSIQDIAETVSELTEYFKDGSKESDSWVNALLKNMNLAAKGFAIVTGMRTELQSLQDDLQLLATKREGLLSDLEAQGAARLFIDRPRVRIELEKVMELIGEKIDRIREIRKKQAEETEKELGNIQAKATNKNYDKLHGELLQRLTKEEKAKLKALEGLNKKQVKLQDDLTEEIHRLKSNELQHGVWLLEQSFDEELKLAGENENLKLAIVEKFNLAQFELVENWWKKTNKKEKKEIKDKGMLWDEFVNVDFLGFTADMENINKETWDAMSKEDKKRLAERAKDFSKMWGDLASGIGVELVEGLFAGGDQQERIAKVAGMVGSTIGAVIGTSIGAAFGGPTGAMIGANVGAAVGGGLEQLFAGGGDPAEEGMSNIQKMHKSVQEYVDYILRGDLKNARGELADFLGEIGVPGGPLGFSASEVMREIPEEMREEFASLVNDVGITMGEFDEILKQPMETWGASLDTLQPKMETVGKNAGELALKAAMAGEGFEDWAQTAMDLAVAMNQDAVSTKLGISAFNEMIDVIAVVDERTRGLAMAKEAAALADNILAHAGLFTVEQLGQAAGASKKLKDIEEERIDIVKQLANADSMSAEQITNLKDKLSGLDDEAEGIEKGLLSMTDATEKFGDATERAGDNMEETSKQAKDVGHAGQELGDGMGKAADSTARLNNDIGGSGGAIDNFKLMSTTLGDSGGLTSVVDTLKVSIENLSSAIKAIPDRDVYITTHHVGQGDAGGVTKRKYAAGGDFIVSQPTMLTAGEAGAERVSITPLSSARGGVDGGATFNFYAPVVLDDISMGQFTDTIRKTINRNEAYSIG